MQTITISTLGGDLLFETQVDKSIFANCTTIEVGVKEIVFNKVLEKSQLEKIKYFFLRLTGECCLGAEGMEIYGATIEPETVKFIFQISK